MRFKYEASQCQTQASTSMISLADCMRLGYNKSRCYYLNIIEMGNCECVSTAKSGFGEAENQDVNIKIITQDEFGNDLDKNSLISFSTISYRSHSKDTSFVIPYTYNTSLKQTLNHSFSLHQIQLNTEIEVDSKITLKEFYDLKKLVQKYNDLVVEVGITEPMLAYKRANSAKIYEQSFIKIKIKADQTQQVAFFRGNIQSANNTTIIEGNAEIYFANGAYYNGNISRNQFHKTGLYVHQDKDYYYGGWKRNRAQGFGQFHHYEGVIYKGEWVNDLQDGVGEEYWPDGAYFRGYFNKGNKKSGKFEWPNKSSYEGQFVKNLFCGKGVFIWQDGKKYEGGWKDNLIHGKGVFTWPNGQVFKGQYENQKKHGKGELKLGDGTIIKGTWVDGKLQGNSEVLMKNGQVRCVRWKNGNQV